MGKATRRLKSRTDSRLKLAVGALAAMALAGAASAAGAPKAPPMPAGNDYSQGETWTCLPGRKDACNSVDLSATRIEADGTMTRESFEANPDAPIDCIYLYPTASEDPTGNSDMKPGPGETGAATFHLGRFGSVCRTFAPLYRSATLASVMEGKSTTPVDPELAYRDVRDAWNYYLARYNQGRGVVLIGHSQGAGLWARLIREEIDGKPVASKLVSALLLGPPTLEEGGAFKATPPCARSDQLGCFVAYSAYRADGPAPPATAHFARVGTLNPKVACVNPAALGGGSGPLDAYLPSWSLPPGKRWVQDGAKIETLFVTVPGLLTAECVRSGDREYLAVTVHGDPKDPRIDDIGGDWIVAGKVDPAWGFHGIDPNLALGNLVEIVRAQAKAYGERR